jgi:hypothetical protein
VNEARRLLEALRELKLARQSESESSAKRAPTREGKPFQGAHPEGMDVFRFFGSWRKSAVLYAVVGLLLLAWLFLPSFARGYPLEGAPKEGQHMRSQAHGHVGSLAPDQYGYFNRHAYSLLQAGQRRDSRMVVYDEVADGWTAIEHAYGCGRHWTVTDPNGAVNRNPGVRETGCNMAHHQTQSYPAGGPVQPWGPPSYHPN